MNSISRKEADILVSYEAALVNVTDQEDIKTLLAGIGYDEQVIAEGRDLLDDALRKFQVNKNEDAGRSIAYDEYSEKWNQADEVYRKHRKIARIVFGSDPGMLEKLSMLRRIPNSYGMWINSTQIFYKTLLENPDYLARMQRLNFTEEDANKAIQELEELKRLRNIYMKEKGEAQDATRMKDAAFEKIDDWMSEFYAVSRIALEERPELLESLSKVVKE